MVTGEEAAADRPFQQALAVEVPSLWLATVNREGRFRLVLRRGRQTSVVREARLDLDKLLACRGLSRPVAPLLDTAAAAVPALLRQKPFPLLLSHSPIKFRWAWAGRVAACCRSAAMAACCTGSGRRLGLDCWPTTHRWGRSIGRAEAVTS